MKVYQVINNHDYGQETCGVYSTIEKARDRIDEIYSRECGGRMTIIEQKIDNPNYEWYLEEYVRDVNKKLVYVEE